MRRMYTLKARETFEPVAKSPRINYHFNSRAMKDMKEEFKTFSGYAYNALPTDLSFVCNSDKINRT